MENLIVKMEHSSKTFAGVKVLNDVDFMAYAGEAHALMGANGAGKSTLMKILAGVYDPDPGTKMYIEGQNVKFKNVHQAQQGGVAMVFQELNILPHLNVLENIFEANEIMNGPVYNWAAMRKRAKEVMDEVGIDLDLKARAGDLSVADQQMIEITRALNLNTKVLIFDEPTSSLTLQETERLFDLIERLKERGVAIIYITHRMSEVYKICDRITLLRDGELVFTDEIGNVTNERLLKGIVGSDDTNQFPEKNYEIGETIFEAKNVSCAGKYEDVSFELKEGEILGFAGIAGAGRTEIMKTIFGVYKLSSGEFLYKGKRIKAKSPVEAVRQGIGYLSEDRKNEGILAVRSIKENMSLADMFELGKNLHIRKKEEIKQVDEQISALKIKTTGREQHIENLSGGNQQKVCLAKWLVTDSKLLLLDEPTRGVDVGARADFYKIIQRLAKNGIGVIVVSSEEDELIGLCNRIVVMRDGKKISEYSDKEENLKEKMLKDMLDI